MGTNQQKRKIAMNEPYTNELYDRLNRLDRQIRKTAAKILTQQPDKIMPQFNHLLYQIINTHNLIGKLTHMKELTDREEVAQ